MSHILDLYDYFFLVRACLLVHRQHMAEEKEALCVSSNGTNPIH